jgi:hypothetical protein
MEVRFMDTEWPTLDFKPIETERIAFKENYSNARYWYTQVMRGYLSFDRKSGTVEVVGLLNYFALAYLLAFLAGGLVAGASSGFIIAFGGLLVLGMCYAIQARRYDAVLSAAAAEWGQELAPAQGTGA